MNSETVGSVTLASAGGAATAAAATYAITPSAATGGTFNANNYTITYNNGTLTVNKANSSGIVSTSKNPSLPGENITFSFAVTAVAPGAGIPTGNVQFRINGSSSGSPVPLVGGTASYNISTLTVGTHTVAAEYGGSADFIGTTNTLASVQLVNTPPVAGADTIDRDPTNGSKVVIVALLS